MKNEEKVYDKVVSEVRRTNDYSKFKYLEGNRGIDEKRVQRIVESFELIGYIRNPIIVNEKFEIIDGQGRVEACKRLQMPVEYCIVKGIGVIECQAMNTVQQIWHIPDWIDSYANLGNENYIRFRNLYNEMADDFKRMVVYAAAKGMLHQGNFNKNVKTGKLVITEDDVDRARETLEYLKKFKPMFKRIGGRIEWYDFALLWCHMDPEVDDKRLFKNVEKNQISLRRPTSIETALRELEEVYNKHGKKKAYPVTNRRRYIENSSIGVAIKGKLKKGMIYNPDWKDELEAEERNEG